MTPRTLSSRFQVVIPKHVREAMRLKPGMPTQLVQNGDRIEIIPVRPMKASRGLLAGTHPSFEREQNDR